MTDISNVITSIQWERLVISTFPNTKHLVQLQIAPEDYDDTDLIIESSNESILSYDGTYITCSTLGTATLTAYSASDPTIKTTLSVEISDTPKVVLEDFNSLNRQITMKLEIYFDGEQSTPLTIKNDDYLMSLYLLESAGSNANNPLGSVAANELSFTLFNESNIFSPTNEKGPYYQKIKTGILIKPYATIIDVNDQEKEWLSLGRYFVTEWSTQVESLSADVTAADEIQDILDSPIPDLPMYLDIAWKNFLEIFLKAAGFKVEVDPTLSHILSYGYLKDAEMIDLLNDMMASNMADLITKHDGLIHVDSLDVGTPKVIWTDKDQLKTISLEQSIIKNYGGVKLTYSLPQLSEDQEILKISSFTIPSGVYEHSMISYDKPIYHISAVSLSSEDANARIKSYRSTNLGLYITTESSNASTVGLSVTGKNIDIIQQVLTDNAQNELKVETEYIQGTSYADDYKEKLKKLVNATIPELTVTVRGNFLIEIGDTVQVISDKYNISFTGIVRTLDYTYNGALECKATLLNAEVIS